MKIAVRVILATVIGVVFLAATAFAADPTFSGFLGDDSVYKQMEPGPEGGVNLRWLKPGVDFKKYNKFMVDSVIFYLADKAENKAIDPEEMKEMADSFNKAIVEAFKDKYPIVAEPGPDVARIRFAITNVEPSKPGVSAVTSILPIGLAVSLVKKGASGGWSGGGETGAEVMVLDSTTSDVIARAVDRRQAEFSERFSKWGSATDAFKFWAGRLVSFVDAAQGIKREPEKK